MGERRKEVGGWLRWNYADHNRWNKLRVGDGKSTPEGENALMGWSDKLKKHFGPKWITLVQNRME